MADYSLVPVDYQPDFENVSLVPVNYNPFSADDETQQQAPAQPAQIPIQSPQTQPQVQQAQFQQPQTQLQPAQPVPQTQPQQPATGVNQPVVNGLAAGNGPAESSGGAGAGNVGSASGGPAVGQSALSGSAPLVGYANPTPTESLVDQARKQAKKVQVELVKPGTSADQGSNEIRQKIVGLASDQIGSGAWDFKVAKGNFPKNRDKCNLFVHDVLTDAGATPGYPNGHWWWKVYPPTAANWADPFFEIPGWRVLGSGESPLPGDVVGQQIQWSNGATGHVMIVGPNANFIGVGESEKVESVAAKMMGGNYPDPNARPSGLLVYRRYEP